MRIAALVQELEGDTEVKHGYLGAQNYSFGQAVLHESKGYFGLQRPDVQNAAEELHPIGRVKNFAPYAVKIKARGGQAVITGNWAAT